MNGNLLKKEYGDYQTPISFAYNICSYLKNQLKIDPSIILEPTCGVGNFIQASVNTFENIDKIYGVEINKDYCSQCIDSSKDNRVTIFCDNFFSFRTQDIIKNKENVLIVGNPPWATNSDLNFNLPQKINFKKLNGTDAITGASNFDICEYIILKLLGEFKNTNTTIAMLCKTSVARNVFIEIAKNKYSSKYVKIINFNAGQIFGISASACLLVIQLSNNTSVCNECYISNIDTPDIINCTIKYNNGVLTNVSEKVCDFDGYCQFEWRQGVKHDCSSIMELKKFGNNCYINKKKEIIELEDTLVFPLIKSSSFKNAIIKKDFKNYVIVTQKKVKADTSHISLFAPLTWDYLQKNKALFDNRKSSIYNGAPPFSMFGIGDYSYSKYKVGVSGFYKKPLFALLYNEDNTKKPIMLDDTSYFISFDDYDVAYVCMLMLNCEKVQNFLYSISFKDAKRPYTKKILQRIDFSKIINHITLDDLVQTEKKLNIYSYVSAELYFKTKQHIIGNQNIQLSMV